MPTTIDPTILTALQQKGYFSSLKKFAPCHCGQCFAPNWQEIKLIISDGDLDTRDPEEREPKIYTCTLCDRKVPWCYGADDKYFDFCDSCFIAYEELDEDVDEEYEAIKHL